MKRIVRKINSIIVTYYLQQKYIRKIIFDTIFAIFFSCNNTYHFIQKRQI